MKKSKKFVLSGLALLAAITMVLLPLAGCKTEVDTEPLQQEQANPSDTIPDGSEEKPGTPPAIYTVTFHPNADDATGQMKEQTFTAGTAQPLNANGFKRPGMEFNGWNTKADGSGASYADKASFTATGDTDLYARWTYGRIEDEVAVVMDSGGGGRCLSVPLT